MNIIQAILLGIIQGLTEFIPVSSTAHLLLAQTALDLPANDSMFSFLVLVQLGTLVSLFIYFWKDLWSIARATIFEIRSPRQLSLPARLGWFILIATLPALAAGYLLKDAVEALFRIPLLEAAIRLITAAILLTLAEYFGKRSRRLDQMTWLDALVVGFFQVIAVFPGASRSGSTISGGMLRGFDRPSAARFAFLISVPVMLAAGAYEMLDVLRMPDLVEFLPTLATGFVLAAVVGWMAIKWLLAFLGRHSLYVFAGYCAIAGVTSLVLFWTI